MPSEQLSPLPRHPPPIVGDSVDGGAVAPARPVIHPTSHSKHSSTVNASLLPQPACHLWPLQFCPRATSAMALLPEVTVESAGSAAGVESDYMGADDDGMGSGKREVLFEKPLTPSDVGKLNRLVIPKQYAERFFPLGSGGERGLLLSFEDSDGKVWPFRYCYWSSSQSYVLTKGWSRFVKDKRLDAGDIVSFERRQCCRPDGDDFGSGEQLYISWRRRWEADAAFKVAPPAVVPHPCMVAAAAWVPFYYSGGRTPYPLQPQTTFIGFGGEEMGKNPSMHVKAASKRLRLFGVNLDCPTDESAESNISHWKNFDQTNLIFYQDARLSNIGQNF